jgi:hypothetical protein
MKRSEMIQKLSDWCWDFRYDSLSREEIGVCAEKLLGRIEKSGMLPPPRTDGTLLERGPSLGWEPEK